MADLPNTPETRREMFLNAIATGDTSGLPVPVTREEVYLNYIAENGGGSGTTTNYTELSNKPKINNVELLGNISLNDLNIYDKNTIDTIIDAAENGRFEFVQTLPTSDIKTNVLYLVPKQGSANDIKDEYINIDGTVNGWELIGNTQIDLSNYYTKAETDNAFVAKETGKGLSTNDYSDSEKTKVSTAESINASQDALLVDNASKNLLLVPQKHDISEGVEWSVNSEGIIRVQGRWTGSGSFLNLTFTSISLSAGHYIMTGCPLGGDNGKTYILQLRKIGTPAVDLIDNGQGIDFTFQQDIENINVRIIIFTHNDIDLIFYPMIRRAEITDSTFEPYYRSQKQLDADLSEVGNDIKKNTANINLLKNEINYNLLHLSLDKIKSLNTDGIWNENIYTYDNITVTVNTDNTDLVTGIVLNGILEEHSYFYFWLTDTGDLGFEGKLFSLGNNDTIGIENYYGRIWDVDLATGINDFGEGAIVPNNFHNYRFVICIKKANNTEFIPMITKPVFADMPSKPYAPDNTKLNSLIAALTKRVEALESNV